MPVHLRVREREKENRLSGGMLANGLKTPRRHEKREREREKGKRKKERKRWQREREHQYLLLRLHRCLTKKSDKLCHSDTQTSEEERAGRGGGLRFSDTLGDTRDIRGHLEPQECISGKSSVSWIFRRCYFFVLPQENINDYGSSVFQKKSIIMKLGIPT